LPLMSAKAAMGNTRAADAMAMRAKFVFFITIL
jgi:hypothetical protein